MPISLNHCLALLVSLHDIISISHVHQMRNHYRYSFCRAIYNIYFHPLSGIPGPRAWSATRLPFIWALLQGTIVHDIQRLHEKYGPILRIAPNEVTFAQEEAWADIFQSRPDTPQFLKDPTWWKRQPGQSQSLLSAIDPEEHAQIRRLLAPTFTTRALAAQATVLERYVDLLVEQLRRLVSPGAGIDLTPWLNFTTFDIFGDLGFGESFNCLETSRYHPWIALLFNSVKAASFVAAVRYYPVLEWLLMKCIPASLKEMQRQHFDQIADKVNRRLNWELERVDIMSHVIKGRKRETLDIGVINATFMVLTTAGSETTATVLSRTLNYLVNNPDKLTILANEILQKFQDPDDIKLDALQHLDYLDACISEGLRLCVPIPWVLPRLVPPKGAIVCGKWLPGKTVARLCSPSILAKLVWNFDMKAVPTARLRWEDLRTFLLGEKKPVMVDMSLRARDVAGQQRK
ncbi:cytochrome P450 [Cryphonectria parasitica EP155]|uniref:Cytochrome P450 n=1 Tax=Cryphonectria parasitica (strain ATCC 38755 / EP155) TaxID=660469 RepID=A0A9P4XU82_CRYP1|nr:cytochrome P450 [Cryphonectria parasitica EP155]KAF3761394.1 cytochrome P450 [Cryphonectria parasitica EP155]